MRRGLVYAVFTKYMLLSYNIIIYKLFHLFFFQSLPIENNFRTSSSKVFVYQFYTTKILYNVGTTYSTKNRYFIKNSSIATFKISNTFYNISPTSLTIMPTYLLYLELQQCHQLLMPFLMLLPMLCKHFQHDDDHLIPSVHQHERSI